jgi:hypothetical protein
MSGEATNDTKTGVVKTWGPFTGRQLTTIICVVVVTVMFPFAAGAVTGSNTFITDPVTGNHATVANGALVTGIAPTRNFVSSANVDMNGVPGEAYSVLLTASATHALVITDLLLSWNGQVAANDDFAEINIGTPGSPCTAMSLNAFEYFDVTDVNGHSDTHWSTGYVVPAGKAICVRAPVNHGDFHVRVYGYFVASTAVTSPYETHN